LHKEYAQKTARLGIHVICEKPISLTVEDAQAVIDTCKEHGVRLFIGHVVRFFPDYVQMKQTIDAGRIGRVGTAHLKRVGSHPGDARPWFKDEEKSGGVIVDLMVHDIDFVRWTLGEVKSVYCMRRHENEYDYALVTLLFENGAVANLEGYWGYPGAFRTAAEFAGSKGVIRGDSDNAKSLQVRKVNTNTEGARFAEVPRSPSLRDPYSIELEHFITCIRENKESIVTPQDALKALQIANAARESATTGKAVLF
jgi:predicted dehydrogenase